MEAVEVGDHKYRLESPPSFARRLAVGDVVRVAHHGSSQGLWVEEVLEWGGHSTIQVITFKVAGRDVEKELKDGAASLNCSIKQTSLEGLFSIDVPGGVGYAPLREFLERGTKCGLWDYQEAAISRIHDDGFGR
ncbi:DUF4265 domain-containing protein [Streptomyces sp. RB6PN25]|uniref:DUF4265 domain-containing protein n=1 Tax=Streptomyces humicola TaxID=2953240 RepID=A0ABT1PXA1_9ACTN|nr:DUF4265 domain-containing protein [Streptomyces humicola]MCQ4082301.1 DUF4265 domain-containing protein [Streptomyces humicola]